MIKLLWFGFIIMLVLAGCGWDGTPTRQNDFIPLTSIEITAESPVIAANTSTNLSVKGNFSGQFTRDVTGQVAWSSNSPTVANFSSVAAPSRVTGFSAGTAVLTATVNGISSNFNLTVSSASISSLTITPVTPTVAKGLSTQFTAKGTFSDSTVQDLTADASWVSSSPSVATISDAAANKGFAQALTEGASTVSVSFGGANDSTLLTVTAPVPLSIAIAPTSANLTVGASQSFTVTASLSDGTTQDVTAGSEWASSNTAIATVGNTAADKGSVKAVSVGVATVTAVYGTLPAVKATVTVISKVLESLELNHVGVFTFSSAAAAVFTATAHFTDGTSQVVTSETVWTISNTSPIVASLDANQPGSVLPGVSGSAILTASYGGLTQTVTIFVP